MRCFGIVASKMLVFGKEDVKSLANTDDVQSKIPNRVPKALKSIISLCFDNSVKASFVLLQKLFFLFQPQVDHDSEITKMLSPTKLPEPLTIKARQSFENAYQEIKERAKNTTKTDLIPIL
jgi:hypothetical protein